MSDTIPKVKEIQKIDFLTSIWIVPLVALFIALWLGYQYFSERGPEIRIVFPKNEGLKAGQSQIKYRNVPIGKVTKIILEEEKEGVVVVARMDKEATPYMNEYAKFWIVKPEVGISGVSGLETLFSGTYIDMYSQPNGSFQSSYIGRIHPYRVMSGGEYFSLRTIDMTHIVPGTPVFYQNIRAGQVEHINLGLDNRSTHIVIFIDKKFVPYIHTDSKFWEKSLLNIDFSKGNLDMSLATVKHLILGGIAFSSTREDSKDIVPPQHIFRLYSSKTKAMNQSFEERKKIDTFLLKMKHSISGLKVGSVVRFDGFDIGEVTAIELGYDIASKRMLADVLMEINIAVFRDKNKPEFSGEENLYNAVAQGLRAKPTPLDPLTGMLFIDLTFDHNESRSRIVVQERTAPLFPIVEHPPRGILSDLKGILAKVNRLNLEQLLETLTATIAQTKEIIDDAKTPITQTLHNLKKSTEGLKRLTNKEAFQTIPNEVKKSLKSFQTTLDMSRKVIQGYRSDGLVMRQLSETLRVISLTSEELKEFLKLLNRKPNSLIFGDD